MSAITPTAAYDVTLSFDHAYAVVTITARSAQAALKAAIHLATTDPEWLDDVRADAQHYDDVGDLLTIDIEHADTSHTWYADLDTPALTDSADAGV